MGIKIKVFYPELQNLFGGQESVEVDGRTVGECLNDLIKRYPGAGKLLLDSQGRLLNQVYVYVNAEGVNKAAFTQKVTDKDELLLAVLITGG
jgi:molybdopterin converting factor small subunit